MVFIMTYKPGGGWEGRRQARQQHPQPGDIIQIGYKIQGSDDVIWGSHQIVIGMSDGIPEYRPREAKVDKFAYYWRLPIESKEKIIKDLKHWANPKLARELIKQMQQKERGSS